MKKSLFVLSLVSFALVGCSNNSGESTTSSVETTDANATWQSADSIQTAPMPASMSQPVVTQPSYSQPTYQAPQPISAVTAPAPMPAADNSYGGSQVETVGNCQVVRDGNNAPIYSQITKGCYTDNSYTVGKSDTLYLIGYLTGTNASHIANLNGLNAGSSLKVGQVLRVR